LPSVIGKRMPWGVVLAGVSVVGAATVAVSLWFVRRGDELVCATQRSGSLVRAAP